MLQSLEESEENSSERELIDENYFNLASRVTKLLPAPSANNVPISHQSKLPKFPIPTFDDKYEDWGSFKDSF